MRPSQQFQQDIDDLQAFMEAMHAERALRQPNDPSTFSLASSSVQWHDAPARAARLAGPAERAYVRHATTSRNPVSVWLLRLDGGGAFSMPAVDAMLASAISAAERRRDRAKEVERGLFGVLVRLVRLPTDLREAADPSDVGARRAATAVGVGSQLFVAAVGGALATVLAAGAIALVRMTWDGAGGGAPTAGVSPSVKPTPLATVAHQPTPRVTGIPHATP